MEFQFSGVPVPFPPGFFPSDGAGRKRRFHGRSEPGQATCLLSTFVVCYLGPLDGTGGWWWYHSLTAHQHQKGHTVPKRDNDCNVNSSRYSLSTARCESNSLSGQVWTKCPTRPDTQGRHVEAALMHPRYWWAWSLVASPDFREAIWQKVELCTSQGLLEREVGLLADGLQFTPTLGFPTSSGSPSARDSSGSPRFTGQKLPPVWRGCSLLLAGNLPNLEAIGRSSHKRQPCGARNGGHDRNPSHFH